MPLSKVNRPGLNTGVTDNSDATAITIDSSENCGFGTTSPSYRVHSVAGAGSGIAGYFHNSAGSGNGTALLARGGANNSGAGAFIVQDYNGNEDFKVDGLGRVTMPNQVAFAAYRNSSNNNTTNENPVQYETEIFDVGGNYNTTSDRFTAPVSGKYFISASLGFYKNGDVRAVEFYLRRNGNYYMRCDSFAQQTQGNNTHNQATIAVLISLSANDYVDLYMNATASINIYASTKNNQFCGFLVA